VREAELSGVIEHLVFAGSMPTAKQHPEQCALVDILKFLTGDPL